MLPCPQQHLDDRECRRLSQRLTPGRRTAGDGQLQREDFKAGGRLEGGGNRGNASVIRTQGYVGALPPAPALMVPGREDVDNGLGREGGEVLDELNPGDGSPSGIPGITQTITWFWVAFTAPP